MSVNAQGGAGLAVCSMSEYWRFLNTKGSMLHLPESRCPIPEALVCMKPVEFEFIGVYKEVGFKHGSWHDVGWWRCALAAQPSPDEPIAFAACDSHADFKRQARV